MRLKIRKNWARLSGLLILLFVFSTIHSCKKKDSTNPEVRILTPNTYATYEVFDEIQVVVDVFDEQGLDWLSVEIVTSNNIRVSNRREFNLEGHNEKEVVTTLVVSNTTIDSGDYFIRATASDGSNESSDFHEIRINQIPKVLEKTLLIKENGFDFQIDTFNSQLESGVLFTGQFGFVKGNSVDQRIIIGSENPSKIVGLETGDLAIVSEEQIIDDNSNSFYLGSCFDPIERITYISTHDGKIRGYDKNGIQLSTFSIETGFRPYAIVVHDNFILIEQRSFDQSQIELAVYNKNSGTFFQSSPLDMKLVDLFVNNNRVFLIGNDDESIGKVGEYFIDSNFYDVIEESISSGPILSSANTLMNNQIAFSDEFSSSLMNINSTSIQIIQNWNASVKSMKFDEVSNTIYGLNNSELYSLNANGTITSLLQINGYSEIELIYNR